MKLRVALLCLALSVPFSFVARAADTLDFFVLDVEGGKAVIVRTPAGQSMLIDGGFPGQGDRDLTRIVSAAKALGIREFDYILTTHYDIDHAGNIPAIAAKVPGKVYIDHGALVANSKLGAGNRKAADAYLAFVADKKRMSVKPGDAIPMEGVEITVVASGEQTISKALKGAGKKNKACPEDEPQPTEIDDNASSIGTLWEFGKFRMADFGDLLSWVEYNLVCPKNLVGPIELFMVSHHGAAMSNSPAFVQALHPMVAIMNNGERKVGAPEVIRTVRNSPGFQDLWQLHYSAPAGDVNAYEEFIANLKAEGCQGNMIKVSAHRDGIFTVTNTRNNFTKTYKP